MTVTLFDDLRVKYPARQNYIQTSWSGAKFVGGLVALYSPCAVAEVGCSNGVTASYIVDSLVESGRGIYLGYELNPIDVAEARHRLRVLAEPYVFDVIEGDFFHTCTEQVVDFAYIDIDPKSLYIDAYRRLKLAMSCVVVAHDLTCPEQTSPSGRKYVLELGDVLRKDGFSVSEFNPERGFLVGVRG